MVVVDAVGAAQHRGRRLVKGPRRADTWRPVVEIAFVSGTRHAVGPHGDKLAGLRVVQGRAIVDIDRRRGQVVPQACRERDVRAHAITVLHEPRKRLGSQALGIVETRQRRERGQSRQEIDQRASGERPRKGQRPTRLHVAKRVLTNQAAVESRLDEVVAARPRQRVGDVDSVGRAVLRIVVLVPERRVAGHGDEAESRITRVRPRFGQPDIAIERAPLLWKHAGGDAVESDARFVEQICREYVRGARDEVLSAPLHVAAVPRQQGKPRAAERLKKTTIGEAVARHQIEGAAKRGVAADVEMIGSVALRRRGHVVADLGRTVWTGIERRNRLADRMRQRWRKRAPGRIGRHRRDTREAFIRPRRFVVGKEKRAVPDDGPADGESGLRALVLRIGLALRREIVRRVERAVTEKRVRGAVQQIRA